jgi:hypothetical protein
MTDAARQRLRRERAREGLVVQPVLVVETDVVELLLETGFLGDPRADQAGGSPTPWLLEQLMTFEAGAEDLEDNGDGEPDDDAEG